MKRVLPRFFQQRRDLFALYAGKAFQKLLDRIAGFQNDRKDFSPVRASQRPVRRHGPHPKIAAIERPHAEVERFAAHTSCD